MIQPQQDYLDPQKRKYYQDKVDNINNTLKNIKSSEYAAERNLPVGELLKQKRQAEKVLNERTAPKVDEKERDKLAKRAKYLEGKITAGMPTKDEMMGERKSCPGNISKKFQEAQPSAVRKNIEWTLRTGNWIREWKNIMKILEPDDPNMCNVERLRKGGKT